jgi:uncharacterized membrane protein
MSIKTKSFLAAAVGLCIACAAPAAIAKPAHHPRALANDARASGSYALAPSATNGAASRPRSDCHWSYNYDRALDGYSYDMICNGVDVSPH